MLRCSVCSEIYEVNIVQQVFKPLSALGFTIVVKTIESTLLIITLSPFFFTCLSICLGHWDSMEEYTCMIPRDTHDGAFYRAVLALHQDLYSLAQQVGCIYFCQVLYMNIFQGPAVSSIFVSAVDCLSKYLVCD